MSNPLAVEVVSLAVKMSVVLVLALAAASCMRRQSAAARHWVLSMGILCAVSIPAVRMMVPAWNLPLGGAVWTPSVAHVDPGPDSPTASVPVDPSTPEQLELLGTIPSGEFSTLDWTDVVLPTWAVGAALVLFALGAGLLRLAWLASRSTRVVSGPWCDAAITIANTLGLHRVRVLQSRHPSLLVAWGWWRPTILLPSLARTWQEDRIRAVLAHELAHLRRRDWPIQIGAELLRAMCWFNPLVWIACCRLRRESEQACDDVVLGLGIDVTSYANHLVDIARSLNRRAWLPAPAMARPSSLEGRIVAMLNRDLSRRPLTRPVRVAALLVMSFTALSTASAQTFAGFSGTVFDPTERPIPDVAVVLTNERTSATYSVTSDSSGLFEFVGLVPGDYVLQAMSPGFAGLQARLTITAQDLRQDLRLEVGSLEETISVLGTNEPEAPDPVRDSFSRDRAALARAASLAACKSGPTGGSIIPPTKIHDQRPAYPPGAQVAGMEGEVAIRGLIGSDGFTRDLRVVGTPPADLAAAALDAIGQWEFTPTLLNCTPIDVNISVTTRFALNR